MAALSLCVYQFLGQWCTYLWDSVHGGKTLGREISVYVGGVFGMLCTCVGLVCVVCYVWGVWYAVCMCAYVGCVYVWGLYVCGGVCAICGMCFV